MKHNLMDEVGVLLLRHSYTVKTLTGSSFDMVARKGSRVLLIKVLEDANSISEGFADSMRNLSSYIDASSIIIAEKAGHLLEDGVVYSRFGVYTFNYNTLGGCLESRFPIIVSTKAGFAASVAGEKLRRQREERGFSLGAIARKVGVSKRMVAKYEANAADVSLRGAIALDRLFGSGIFNKVDIFAVAGETASGKQSVVARKYGELGFRAVDAKKAPFNVVAKMEKELILTDVEHSSTTRSNPHLEPLQQLLGADALVILDDKGGSRSSKKLPTLHKRDFMHMKTARELIKFLKEFE